MSKFGVLAAGGLGVYACSAYVGYHLYALSLLPTPPPGCHHPQNQSSFLHVWDSVAPTYDAKVEYDEYMMGFTKMRRNLLSKASGSVLEVSAGTGRNLEFYNMDQINSLVLTDASLPMLSQSLEKFKKMKFGPVSFVKMNSDSLQSPSSSFDTVVDTFGLCSHQDPLASLKEMARVVKPSGHVLLLEHGRGNWEWLNNVLDKTSEGHARTWGCWWNRDVEGLVKESGMEILERNDKHFGTTVVMVCKRKE